MLEKYQDTEIPDWIKQLTINPEVEIGEEVDYKDLKYIYLKERYNL